MRSSLFHARQYRLSLVDLRPNYSVNGDSFHYSWYFTFTEVFAISTAPFSKPFH